jgi:YidC/Oxa1 family membrane protein insertase
MDRNAILATGLVILILIGYQFYLSRFEVPPQETTRAASTQPAADKPSPAPDTVQQPQSRLTAALPQSRTFTPTVERKLTPRDIVVETPLMRVVLSSEGGVARHWELSAYRLDSGSPVDLVATIPNETTPGPLSAWVAEEQLRAVFEVDVERLDLTKSQASGSVTFKHTTETGLELEKKLTFHADTYQVDVALSVRNLSDGNSSAQVRMAWGPGFRNSHNKKVSTIQPPTLWVDGKRLQEDLSKLSADKEKGIDGGLSWAALQDTYFTAALLPLESPWKGFVGKRGDEQPVVGLVSAQQSLAPSARLDIKAQVYAGPRDLDRLKAVGSHLDQLVDLGWFDFLARPALWLVKLLYQATGNYGIAIILITILQKVAFHPLTHKSLKSMKAMQQLQPKVQALQERYKNNPQKKQEETMALYRKHGVNPMGGCLPMVIQIPIFIALYNALSSSVEMWQAHFLWIRDLTQPDALFGITLWEGYPLNFLALLMGVSMWFQQKMSPTGGDPRQAQMMLWTMPIIFTFMFWSFPSGLVLYWLVNNVLQIAQQWFINRGADNRSATPEGQAA